MQLKHRLRMADKPRWPEVKQFLFPLGSSCQPSRTNAQLILLYKNRLHHAFSFSFVKLRCSNTGFVDASRTLQPGDPLSFFAMKTSRLETMCNVTVRPLAFPSLRQPSVATLGGGAIGTSVQTLWNNQSRWNS
jgi:hypothetical protein